MDHSTQRRVAVVGSAQTVLSPAWSDRQHIDLIIEAGTAALKGTGLTIDDVNFVIDSGSDFLDGRSISNCGFLGAMGAHHKEESRVEEDGLWALGYAVDKIAAGPASVGLVIAYSKPSESDVRNYWTGLLEPFVQRPVGLDHQSAAALAAQAYLNRAGLKPEQLTDVARRAWDRAVANPKVEVTQPPADDDFWTQEVWSPLRRSDFARPVDGAVAVVLAADHVAEYMSTRPVWVTGTGTAIDQHTFASRSLDSLPAATHALQSALRRSNRSSGADFDIAEISATSTVGELMLAEALGLAEPLGAIGLYADGAGGQLNPSGGALAADPIMATGLVRLHEAAIRLSGRGRHPADGPRTALVHGTGGFAMQNHFVATLEVTA
jgi:acetyl-CoA C-acetyltransferase